MRQSKNSNRSNYVIVVFLVIVSIVLIASLINESTIDIGQQSADETPQPTDPPGIVIDIASSNTKENWMNAVVEKFNAEGHTVESGEVISVRVSHVTSGGSQQAILEGTLKPTVWSPGESSWVDTANEVWRDRNGQPLVLDVCPQTVFAPTGIAMWRPMAEAMGWPDTPIGWDNLIELASDPEGWASLAHPEWGTFKFGHTHPVYSNVGLQMMTSLAYFAAGKTNGLTAEEVYGESVVEAFRRVELTTYHYGIQSRNLLQLMISRGPGYLHAVTTSEAETLKTNAEQADNLTFPLVFVFPADGTFWSEHPYCLLNGDWVTEQQKEAAVVFLEYLLDPAQQALAIDNFIRPVDETMPLHAPLALEDGTDPRATTATVPRLESPSSVAAQAVKDVFLDTKKPAAVILVLDTSGSMAGNKISSAVKGVQNFVNRLDRRDEVYVLGFNNFPYLLEEGGLVADNAESLNARLGGLFAEHGTAMYDAVCEATRLVDELKAMHDANGTPHLYGIILLSDGEDTSSQVSENQMMNMCLPTGESVETVKVFTIGYETNSETADILQRIANRTNGWFREGTPDNIDSIYNAISAEQ